MISKNKDKIKKSYPDLHLQALKNLEQETSLSFSVGRSLELYTQHIEQLQALAVRLENFSPRLIDMKRNGIIEYLRRVTFYLALQYYVVWLILNSFTSQRDFSDYRSIGELMRQKDRFQYCEFLLFSLSILLLTFVGVKRRWIQTSSTQSQRILYAIAVAVTATIYYC